MPDYEETLKELDLSKKERDIYLDLLKRGESKVNEISTRQNLPRTTVYSILNSLVKKGIASHAIKGNVKYFEAADPNTLMRILDEKRDHLNKILPDLQALKKSVIHKPETEIYEGDEGLKTLFEKLLEEKPEEHIIITSHKIFEVLKYYFSHFITRKDNLGIKTRVIGPHTQKGIEYKKKYSPKRENLREIRIIKGFDFNSRIDLFNDKLIITNLEEDNLVSVFIKDKMIADSFRSMFEVMWSIGEKI